MYVMIGILLMIILSQGLGVYKFIKEIREGNMRISLGGKVFRGIWLVVEALALLSILMYGYLCIRLAFATDVSVVQGYGWGAFVVCVFMLIPLNSVGLILRIIYFVISGKKRRSKV